MKRFLTIATAVLLGLLLSVACEKETPTHNEPTPEPKPQPGPLTESHTLLIYMQGNNGLAEFMDSNLQRVLTAFYNVPHDKARIVVFYDRGNYTRLTELYLDDGMAKQRLIKEYETSTSTVDKEFMREVFATVKREAAADSYGLILSSHGGGWVPSDLYDAYLLGEESRAAEQPSANPLFYGQDDSDCMEVPELVDAISDIYFNYIIFDACFMSNVEALYDMRNAADYIIASPAEILGTGFPYEEMIPMLFSREDHMLEEVCKEYMELYASSSGTIALIDCKKLDALAEAMHQVVATADLSKADAESIQPYDNFDYHLYFDLLHYVEMVATEEAYNNFTDTLGQVVLYSGYTEQLITTTGDDTPIEVTRSCGLSCYVAQEECPATYSAWQETAWAQAIE